ncbi:unnamed protein product [Cuscuta campestris]|uniref:Uncharacterized protein n=1 Tax=Cuscuta campestris TaxID=132261 RepID=A0A484KD29_9ASTE|nr:unnamed protein product [Cuscuta campestris]
MDIQRYFKNLEIIYANEAILQGPIKRCYMCCGYGHHYWRCTNKEAIPYEEHVRIIAAYENQQDGNYEDVFDNHVKDEDDVFVEEPASNAQKESHYNDSFLIHDDFVDEVVIEKATLEVIYSTEVISIEYYPLFNEGKSYLLSEVCLKQVFTGNGIMFRKLHDEVPTNSGRNFIIGGFLNFPFDPGILL